MSNKQHGPAPTKWALDGREQDLLHYVYGRPDIKDIKGQPSKVLSAIDDYHSKFNKLMNIGSAKGQHIVDVINERKPSTMIELGVYVGYSAILFGNAVRSQGGKQYFGIEKNPEMAAVANQLVELAGLQDIVRILVGSSDQVLEELVQDKVVSQIELIFLDHWQDRYLPDLWLLEEWNVLKPNFSVVIADNIIMPGAPEYRRWVEATTAQKRQIVSSDGSGALSPNPDLVYETVLSKFDTDFGPDAVTVTRVVGEDKA
ncbi:hypothetical protein N7478_002139 [Penicillium angulare]|uniref:uncharacterized protein n=1 Tax=Penicillium angulare TaxID=116970 RepID=UPI0025408633|nr:uncharacterized protein N7478_002139 [Penicillium angulare]KAJ5289109.1 hypothetical protein N7478_002139 [Penicillium angulare]